MLTPVEIQSKNFKSGGLGYDKKDVENFRAEVLHSYEELYRQNVELKDKVNVLNEGIQYYKTIEKTLQKALMLAEKTSEETKISATKEAKRIETEARTKASIIVADARNELSSLHQQTKALVRQYEKYRLEFRNLARAQMELIDSKAYDLDIKYEEIMAEAQATGPESEPEVLKVGQNDEPAPVQEEIRKDIKKVMVSPQQAADLSKSDDGFEEDFDADDFENEDNDGFDLMDFKDNE